MAGLVGGMSKKELGMVSKKEIFDEIEKMVGEKKMLFEEVAPLMKQIGCWRMLNDEKNPNFYSSALCKHFELAIGEEEKKREGKNEKWLSDFCEVFFSLHGHHYCMGGLGLHWMEARICVEELSGIIRHHEEHDNLTDVAYQTAWDLLVLQLKRKEVRFLMRLESVSVAVLVGGGSVDVVLEELSQPTLEYLATEHCLGFVSKMLKKLRERTNSDEESTRRWACEKLE
ncbi:uncharacterized protein MONOS_523 [Monocercomonoides exilis]|uniref:uncharacterized protein n=1 Tax=Monocercomonoides exilis TaxID=2049356 RepID=UPI00355A1EC0|nr:hypothetical protein MONOS_523 [Monocercomonoides exilis]|eukprot:MONOS_523.1-p1 / transcript=MONOS_523.1 / gene=MONOS_523 / organism=Monocercomonoides_exilis_PA203 / gene_product=unspecified product / transcript_product=unspecified product / location=Mono_scaffold00008:159324-160474(-) / protein_length=228 / sequence_SO=supercontig / SO=protein_coding / is_pseudo=false